MEQTMTAPDLVGGARHALRRMAMAAWLAILLGFAMQVLILVAKITFGAQPGLAQVIVDFAQGITWAFFVCAGISFGTAIAKARPALGGLTGLISAPVAVGFAKGSQKAMGTALGLADKPLILSLLTIGALRALEYGFLGWTLAWLASRPETKMSHFLLTGVAAGVVFGSGITLLTIHAAALQGASLAVPQIVATAFNEIVFPIGCTFVVYVALQIGQHVKLVANTQVAAG
jgi:hypothetical protein